MAHSFGFAKNWLSNGLVQYRAVQFWEDRQTHLPQVKIGIGKIAKSIRIGISILFLLEEKLGIGIGKGEIFKNGSRRISLALIWGQPQYQIYPNKKLTNP